jgi:hypothetical protein
VSGSYIRISNGRVSGTSHVGWVEIARRQACDSPAERVTTANRGCQFSGKAIKAPRVKRLARTTLRGCEKCGLRAALVALTLLAAAGCGPRDGVTRVPVQGTVKYQGQPVRDGQIRFIPQGDSRGPTTLEAIVDGQYRCDYKGGVPVGTHRVEIYSWDPSVPAPKGPGSPPRPQFLPPEYNDNSTLSLTIEPQKGVVTKDFELP